ncbi:SAVED domain-containing protein [Escherichia coli]|nr:SAVED domain-containing protein [Escherichia coli]
MVLFRLCQKFFINKTSQDNAKGADSVHLVLYGDDDFTLWFGEAKFYNSIEDARLSSIINSVGDALRTDKLRKENSIITNTTTLTY